MNIAKLSIGRASKMGIVGLFFLWLTPFLDRGFAVSSALSAFGFFLVATFLALSTRRRGDA